MTKRSNMVSLQAYLGNISPIFVLFADMNVFFHNIFRTRNQILMVTADVTG